MTKKRVLITGAAGTIGTILRKGLGEFYLLTLLDLIAVENENSIALDVANEFSRLKEIFSGHDVIIHLARDNRGGFKSGDNWVPENDVMIWNVYKAAVESGVKRVIMASSIHAVDFSNWEKPGLIPPDEYPNPDTPYGAMKIFMETMGKYFSAKRGLEVICLRFGGVNPEDVPEMSDEPDYQRIWLSHGDLVNLVKQSIEMKEIPGNFQIVFGVSNNTGRVHDFKNSVGWLPKDNAELKLKEVQRVYYIRNEELIPERIKHIIWDVNGTITNGDVPDKEVLQEIVALAKKGVHHSFITGRDGKWLRNFLISPLSGLEGFEKAVRNLHFYPELGLIKLDPISGEMRATDLIVNHPIANPEVRRKIADLFYRGRNLLPYQGKEREGYFAGGDADNNFFLIPEKPEVEFPWFFWSESKELMGTAEVIRNRDTSLNKDCAARINETKEKLEQNFKAWNLHELIKVSPVSTALNLVPIVGGLPLDKDVAAGITLYNLSHELQMNIHEICSQTIAIGDGTADLLLTTPVLGLIPICFVGPKTQLRPTVLQEKQVVILAEGALKEDGSVGPPVTREILKVIETKTSVEKNVIYLRGEDDLEEFEGTERLERGIEKRIRHFIGDEDIHIHDAFLDPSLQEGHVHTAGYEAIMLEEGDIDALVWTEEGIQTYPLTKWGDMIIFLPRSRHTLLVKKPSRIIVSKAHRATFAKDHRYKVDLPAGMEDLRREMLNNQKPIDLVLKEVESKL